MLKSPWKVSNRIAWYLRHMAEPALWERYLLEPAMSPKERRLKLLCCKDQEIQGTGRGNRVPTRMRRGAVAAPHAAQLAGSASGTSILATEQLKPFRIN